MSATHAHRAKGIPLHFSRMDFIDQRPASPDRPQAAFRRAVRLARVAERYADPWAANDTSIHRHDFIGDGAEYLSVTVTDPSFGTEAHLTVTLEVDADGHARPYGGTLTLKGLRDADVWSLIALLSPLLPPVPAGEFRAPRGAWWERHRSLNPGAWHDCLSDILPDRAESTSADARTGNDCTLGLYLDGANHQLNVGMTIRHSSAGSDIRDPVVLEGQLTTLTGAFVRWGALSAARSASIRGLPSPFPL